MLTVVLGLAGELGRRHDVDLVSVTRRNDVPVHRLPDNVRLRTLVDGTDRAALLGVDDPDGPVARYLSSLTGTAVVASQPTLSVAVAKYAPLDVVKVAQEHRPLRSRSPEQRDLALRHYPRLDMLLTLTERQARRYRRLLRRAIPVQAVPNGSPDYSGPLSDGHSRVVVAAGRLKRTKGFDRLIDAWALVQPSFPDWRLEIYGDGPLREDLTQQMSRNGVADSVFLMGYATGLVRRMADASVFVLSSRAEGYPMVLLEAMSAGLAVVSVDCPTGPREIVSSGHNGLLVPNDDIPALAAAMADVMSSQSRRKELGSAAREHAVQNSQSAIARRWEQLLDGLLLTKQGSVG